jgi:hypothetical protein
MLQPKLGLLEALFLSLVVIYRIFSNLIRARFTVSEGQKNQMQIRI